MSFIDTLVKIGILQPTTPALPQQKGISSNNFFSFFSPTSMPKMGEKEQLRAYRGWTYACTNAIADIELKYQEKTEDGWQDYEGDAEPMKTLQWVNDFMSFSELAFNCVAYQELNGNSFWYVVYNGNGKSVEIWPMDPTRVQIAKDDKEFVRGYVFINDKQEQVPLKREEVVHFKRFHPYDLHRGMGTVEVAGNTEIHA